MFDPRPPLPPAQLFSGDYSYPIEQFLTLLETTFPLLNIPTEDERKLSTMKIGYLVLFLTGRARLWYTEHVRRRELAVRPVETYEQLKALLVQVFGGHDLPVSRRGSAARGSVDSAAGGSVERDRRQAEQTFARMIQRSTVKDYAQRYQAASLGCGYPIDLDSEYECLWFVHGLKPGIREYVLRVFHPGMGFEDVVREAQSFE